MTAAQQVGVIGVGVVLGLLLGVAFASGAVDDAWNAIVRGVEALGRWLLHWGQ